MAFDENLAGRIRKALIRKKGITDKKMFGGIGFPPEWKSPRRRLEEFADRPAR